MAKFVLNRFPRYHVARPKCRPDLHLGRLAFIEPGRNSTLRFVRPMCGPVSAAFQGLMGYTGDNRTWSLSG